jgi:hypothetical protein
MQQQQSELSVQRSALDGLWVLLVENEGQAASDIEGRVPMMARTGNDQTYLLGFKNAHNARRFLEASAINGAEPRMVVKSNKSEFLRVAQANGVVGVLVDYDPTTQQYSAASELY